MPLIAVAFLAAALLTLTLGWFELRHWRKSVGAHWTERARQLYPARAFRGSAALFSAATITLAAHLYAREAFWPMLAGAAYFGAILGLYPLDRVLLPGIRFVSWLHGVAASLVLTFLGWGALFLALVLMPRHGGGWTPVVVGGYVAIRMWIAFGGNLTLLRLLRVMRPAPPAVQAMARAACAEAGVSVRAVWEFRDLSANALAFTATRELGYTSTLLAEAPMDELRAITEHEIAHLREGRALLAGRLLSDFATLPVIFWFPALEAVGPWGPIGLLAAVWALYLARKQLVRWLERRADQGALHQLGDGATYARALERLHRINRIPAVTKRSVLATHPNLYDRMVAAGVTPDYPRPEPPDLQPWSLSLLSGVSTLMLLVLFNI